LARGRAGQGRKDRFHHKHGWRKEREVQTKQATSFTFRNFKHLVWVRPFHFFAPLTLPNNTSQ